MKKLLILLLFTPVFCFSQSKGDSTGIMPYNEGKIHFTDVVVTNAARDKELLIKNAIIWFQKTTHDYNNSIHNKESFGLKDNIILQNIEKGEFVGTLNMLVQQSLSESLISFDVYIYAKDGKYKYDFTDFKYLGNSMSNKIAGQNMNTVTSLESIDKKKWKKLMSLIYKSCQSAILKLNEQMNKKENNF